MPHIHDKIDFAVETFIVYKGKVLLRRHDKYDMWLSVGGHIELDEDPNQAAVREVKEEVGLDVELVGNPMPKLPENGHKELIPPKYLNRHKVGGTAHEHVCFVYFAKAKNSRIKPERESDVWGWFTKEEIETRTDLQLQDDIKFYALDALKTLS